MTTSTSSSIALALAGLFALATGCVEDLPQDSGGPDAGAPGDPDDPGDPGDPDDPGDPGDPDDPGDPGDDDPTAAFACPEGSAAIAEGLNTLVVDGVERSFFADLPADPSQPMGILFSWHGFGDSADNFRNLGFDPDADPDVPVLVITPEDSGLAPFGDPQGLDWDIRSGMPDYDNVDFAFFEAMVGCAVEQLPIDTGRIASFGFSAGSVMTSLLHSRYPTLFSAIIPASGVWFNDPAQIDMVNFIQVDWQWPALADAGSGTPILLTHGGAGDVIAALGFQVIDLEAAAQAALPFLADAGRVVIDCAHDGGHVLHPEVTAQVMSAFVAAHRAGEPSPYAGGDLSGLPASCTLVQP